MLCGLPEFERAKIMLFDSWHLEKYREHRWEHAVSFEDGHDLYVVPRSVTHLPVLTACSADPPHRLVQRMCQKAKYADVFERPYIVMPVHLDDT